MKLLITISDPRRLALLLDLESGAIAAIPTAPEFFDQSVSGRARCRPYGISWSNDELFISNNRQILVFDKALRFRAILTGALHGNTHQLQYTERGLWAVSPWSNSLILVCSKDEAFWLEFDLLQESFSHYRSSVCSDGDDRFHFSSLLWLDDKLFVTAHNFSRPSFILVYETATMLLAHMLTDVGRSIHGIAAHHGHLHWVSSGTHQIRSSSGVTIALNREGYARGFAVTEDYFIVGTSERGRRLQREYGNSWVCVLERATGKLVKEYELNATGNINDIRLLDTFDFAHHIAPFWGRRESFCAPKGRGELCGGPELIV